MDFIEVIHTKNHKRTYYIDDKKVTGEIYLEMLLIRSKNYKTNSAKMYKKDDKIYNVYTLN